jgi:hypothetical protein
MPCSDLLQAQSTTDYYRNDDNINMDN